ncbi:hypothetical protein T492DRAFT_895365 [Pavlovales sp. CCMP2436]|nr:hypothetical protein T492DRAFT_895365 [Pavlovales sp. CCMP2436]
MYFAFFFSHLTHRGLRDAERCAKKYGKDWDRYCDKSLQLFGRYRVTRTWLQGLRPMLRLGVTQTQ